MKKYPHPSIINEQIVLSMAILLLLMSGLMIGILNTKQASTQTKAQSPVPIRISN